MLFGHFAPAGVRSRLNMRGPYFVRLVNWRMWQILRPAESLISSRKTHVADRTTRTDLHTDAPIALLLVEEGAGTIAGGGGGDSVVCAPGTGYVPVVDAAAFCFHLMTAYSILRAQKIDLGKADYVAHMLPHIRPESMRKG